MNKILQLILKILAKLVLLRYKPKVVGVTGSVGKSNAKEAIYTVMSAKYNVRQNIKNYNNEIGLPLTILGMISPGRSLIGWFLVFWKAFILILIKEKNYPEILVLEMGIDRPGDMDYLLSITKCDIGVITLIGQSHLEYFGTVDAIEKEKIKIIKNLKKGGKAVLNFDDKRTDQILKTLENEFITIGFNEGSKLKVKKSSLVFNGSNDLDNLKGISFEVNCKDSMMTAFIPDAISKISVYACLFGIAVGIYFDIELDMVSEALRTVKMSPGRLKMIKGIKQSLIVDDTYNSAPQSSRAALDAIVELDEKDMYKKYAVLGDMLELGDSSMDDHIEIGKYVVKSKIDILITVGDKALDIAKGAEDAGMDKDKIFSFKNSEEAGVFIKEKLKLKDLLIVKGSQGARMEKIVKEIMAEPSRAEELLCRQDEQWV